MWTCCGKVIGIINPQCVHKRSLLFYTITSSIKFQDQLALQHLIQICTSLRLGFITNMYGIYSKKV